MCHHFLPPLFLLLLLPTFLHSILSAKLRHSNVHSDSDCCDHSPPDQYIDIPFEDPVRIDSYTFTLSNTTIAQWDHLPVDQAPISLQVVVFDNDADADDDFVFVLLGQHSLWVGKGFVESESERERRKRGKAGLKNLKSIVTWRRIDDGKMIPSLRIGPGFSLFVASPSLVLIGGRRESSGMPILAPLDCSNASVTLSCRLKTERILEVGKYPIARSPVLEVCDEKKEEETVVLLGLERELVVLDLDSWKVRHRVEDVNVTAMSTISREGTCKVAMATPDRLFLFDVSSVTERKDWVHYWSSHNQMSGPIRAVAFDPFSSSLWVGSANALNHLDDSSGMWTRIGGRVGLPYGNVTTLRVGGVSGRLYVGTTMGVGMYLETGRVGEPDWQYWYGDRWVHGDPIRSIQEFSSASGDIMVVLLTDVGAAVVEWCKWTLLEKALFYEAMVRPRHDRFGLVSDVALQSYGDLTTYQKVTCDNDGLRTSIYLDSLVFRYALTKDSEVKKKAWDAFAALELLNKVTGIKGFMARSVRKVERQQSHLDSHIAWYNSTVYPEFQFEGDTSADETTGHLTAYPLMYYLVAETPSEKARVATLIDDVVGHIVDHGYRLVGPAGPTTWGFWGPKELNDVERYAIQRGLNSLEIVAYLLNAYAVTGKKTYLEHYRSLVNEHGYGTNLLNARVTFVDDVNHNDAQLSYLNYLGLAFALKNLPDPEFDPMRVNLKRSIEQYYVQYTIREKSSLFASVFRFVTGSQGVEETAFSLKTWPQSLIEWPCENRQRIDILSNPEPYLRERWGFSENMHVLPTRERFFIRWNQDPFELHGGTGFRENDPGPWLIGYWFGRYVGIIVEQEK